MSETPIGDEVMGALVQPDPDVEFTPAPGLVRGIEPHAIIEPTQGDDTEGDDTEDDDTEDEGDPEDDVEPAGEDVPAQDPPADEPVDG